MKILLVDNEKAVRETLAKMVHNWSKDVHQVEEATGVKDGIEKLLNSGRTLCCWT